MNTDWVASLGWEGSFPTSMTEGPCIMLSIYKDFYFGHQNLHGNRKDFCHELPRQGKALREMHEVLLQDMGSRFEPSTDPHKT